MSSTRAQLRSLLATTVLSGGRRTTAQFVRDFENEIIASLINKIDDANVVNGYLGIDSSGKVNSSFIKSGNNLGYYLRDDGTWQSVSANKKQTEKFTITGTTLSLTYSPTFVYGFYANGFRLTDGDGYTLSGNIITFLNSYVGQSLVAIYDYISSPIPVPHSIGTLALNQFNAGDYSIVGAANPTFNSGSSITLSGGTAGVGDYITYNGFISSRNSLKRTLRFTVDTFDASSYGIGPKMVSINSSAGSQFNNTVFGVTSNNSEKGKIYWSGTAVNNTDGSPNGNSGASVVLVNLNNTMELIVEQKDLLFTMKFYNLTLDPSRTSPATYSYQMPTSYPFNNGVYHNTAKNAIACFGGTQTIIYDNTETDEYEYCDLAIIGDSKTTGLGCNTVVDRFGYLWSSNNPTKKVSIFSGSSDKTNEVILALPDIIKSKPKKTIVFIGRNDISNAIAPSVWQVNLQTIDAALSAFGTVYYQLPTPEVVLNQTSLTNYLNASFPGRVIPVPSSFVANTDNVNDSGNYIHPNTGGHLKIYNTQASIITL